MLPDMGVFMRHIWIVCLLVLLSSVSSAQDINFSELQPISARNASQLIELGVSGTTPADYYQQVGQGKIRDAELSINGNVLALATDLAIWVYKLDTPDEPPLFIPRPTTGFTTISLSPDEPFIASLSQQPDDIIRVWDYTTGQLVHQLFPTDPDIAQNDMGHATTFSPDGKLLATGHDSGRIWLWSANTENDEFGLPISVFQEDDFAINELSFVADSTRLWSNQLTLLSRAWDVSTGRIDEVMTDGEDYDNILLYNHPDPYKVQFSPDGIHMLLGIRNANTTNLLGAAEYYDTNGDKTSSLWSYSIDVDEVTQAAIHPDGDTMALGTEKGFVHLLDSSGNLRRKLLGDGTPIDFLLFSQSQNQLVTVSQSQKIVIWNIALNDADILDTHFLSPINDLAILPDSQSMMIARSFQHNITSQQRIGAIVEQTIPHNNVLTDYISESFYGVINPQFVVYSPNGTWIATPSWDNDLVLLNNLSGDIFRIGGYTQAIHHAQFNPDSTQIATIDRNRALRITEVSTGDQLGGVLFEYTPESFAYSPDSKHIVVIGKFGEGTILDSQTLEIIKKFDTNSQQATVEISKDGQVILIGGGDIILLDFHTLQVINKIGQSSGIARFTMDDSAIVVGNKDTIEIWGTCSQQMLLSQHIFELPTISKYQNRLSTLITQLELSPDGKFLITYSSDMTLRYWGIPSDNSIVNTINPSTDCIITPTPTATATFTPSHTPTITPTSTITSTPTLTFTPSITPTSTSTATPTITPTPLPAACQNAPIPRLIGFTQGRVLDDDPLPINMRDGAGTGFNRILEVPAGAIFATIQGPQCSDGFFWYQIDYNGTIGWIAEGDSLAYYTEPAPSG